MSNTSNVPIFTLYGETDAFPDVLHCEKYSARAPIHDWHISAHKHARLSQLFIIVEGGARAEVNDRHVRLTTGMFLFVPAQTKHAFVFEPGTEGYVVSVPSAVLKKLDTHSGDMQSSLSQGINGECCEDVLQLAKLLERTLSAQGPFRVERALGLAQTLLGLVAETAVTASTTNFSDAKGRLRDFEQLIMDNFAANWTAAQYAKALFVSTGHLSRLCRQAVGKGATAYIEEVVMDEACRMLAFTQLPVSEIGYRLGFADPSYFSKRFRKLHQNTPSAYRAQFAE